MTARHRCSADSISLKAMASRAAREPWSPGAEPHRRERRYDDRVGCLELDPVLGGEVEEGEQHVEVVDDLGDLVNPAPLVAGLRPHVAQRRPEAQRAVTNGQYRDSHAAVAELPQQDGPAVSRLPVVVEGDWLLGVVGATPKTMRVQSRSSSRRMLPGRSRCMNPSSSACYCLVNRVITELDGPAAEPKTPPAPVRSHRLTCRPGTPTAAPR